MRSLLRPFVLLFAVALAGCSAPARLAVEVEGAEVKVKLLEADPVEAAPGGPLDAPTLAPGVRLTMGPGVSRVRVLQRGDATVHVAWHTLGEPDAAGARELRAVGSLELQPQGDGTLLVTPKGAAAGTVARGLASYELEADGTLEGR